MDKSKSPYAPYLHTNYPPSASEILDIKNFLTEPLGRLSALDAEIERLDSIIRVLCDERCALSDEIEAHQALISPFRRLPLDIMEEIFTHCLPTHHNAVMSVGEAPLLLGRVCSAWRSITLATPRLWASLHIPTPTADLSQASVRKLAVRCEAVREWFLRSGEVPLSISLYTPNFYYSWDSSPDSLEHVDFFGRVSRQILPFSRQWKTVYLRGMGGSFTHTQEIVEGDVPMLESLSIVNLNMPMIASGPQDFSQAGEPWKKSSGLLSAPKLRSLSLTNFGENPLGLPVCWSRLTHLKLDADGSTQFSERPSGLRYSQVVQVLKKCPLLVSCSFRLRNTRFNESLGNPSSSFEMPPSQYTLSLPLLQHFSLSLTGRSDEAFLKYLGLPALRHLEVKVQKSDHEISENQRSVLMDFLSQNGVKLKKLSIEIWAMEQDELICCLKSVPFVTHLHLNNFNPGSVDEEIADRLTPSGSNPDYLCPLLEEFHCEGSQCASFSEAHLLSFVVQRRVSKNGGVLKRVHVIFHRNRPENIEEFFAFPETVLEGGDYINYKSEGLDYRADARISVESGLGHEPITFVDVEYALEPSIDGSLSPWEGLDGHDYHPVSSPRFTLRM
ncbi:uncharacterized protein LACBIDRAFT_307014 [Laccaria bicolor S238N-H82]|uniref:Predicted protein n=1 Tax=Laccaria bicolor (strain S238N-H82 / ATCC MYA-4686) TaxID=486041 RepID=B0DP63_LACBS|nr:uncharacterized protein LACBIDRAFT_307014 [Laccaria bicolor S238N-H82]EDR03630.1 predicted protein [Laccaria bicolor S238N-H82]|eukprot:XP_001885778.1 predicted protein [Laccaria bicolor S238N-H82]